MQLSIFSRPLTSDQLKSMSLDDLGARISALRAEVEEINPQKDDSYMEKFTLLISMQAAARDRGAEIYW